MAPVRCSDMPSGTLRDRETLSDINRSIEQNPDDAKALAHRGENHRLTGHFEAALDDFNRVIALEPDYAWAIAHRGETYYLMKRYQEAFADFNRAIELNPDYNWAIAHRGASYHRLNYYQQALVDFNQAIEQNPNYAWAIFYRGTIYALMNRYEEALVDSDNAIALDQTLIPNWPGERGLLLSYLGRYAEAISCCEQGLEGKPDDYITLYTLAVVKARWKSLTEAQKEINKTQALLEALVNMSICASVLYRLGGLAAIQGDSDQALNYLQEAISLENEPLELARRDLAWLDLRDHPRFKSLISD